MRSISIHFSVDEKTFAELTPDDLVGQVAATDLPLVVVQLMNSAEVRYKGAVVHFPARYAVEVILPVDKRQQMLNLPVTEVSADGKSVVIMCGRA